MSKQAAAALIAAGFVAAAALPLRADEAADPLPAASLAAATEAAGDSPDAHRSVPELSAELIFAIALLVTSVASIPGRIR